MYLVNDASTSVSSLPEIKFARAYANNRYRLAWATVGRYLFKVQGGRPSISSTCTKNKTSAVTLFGKVLCSHFFLFLEQKSSLAIFGEALLRARKKLVI